MNHTAIASSYRKWARLLADEALRWTGTRREELLTTAQGLSRAARMESHDPIVTTATLDSAREIWMRATAHRGIALLGKMLEELGS